MVMQIYNGGAQGAKTTILRCDTFGLIVLGTGDTWDVVPSSLAYDLGLHQPHPKIETLQTHPIKEDGTVVHVVLQKTRAAVWFNNNQEANRRMKRVHLRSRPSPNTTS